MYLLCAISLFNPIYLIWLIISGKGRIKLVGIAVAAKLIRSCLCLYIDALAILDWIGDVLNMKTKEYRVQGNRLLFRCSCCGERRNVSILDIKCESIKCMDCGRYTRCLLNRRREQRESLSGILTLRTRENTLIEVRMHDISVRGIGFELLRGKDLCLIKLGDDISLSCNWSLTLIPKSRFRVQNINGFRVGVVTAMQITLGNQKSLEQLAN